MGLNHHVDPLKALWTKFLPATSDNFKEKSNLPEKTESTRSPFPGKGLGPGGDYKKFSKSGTSHCSCCSNQTAHDLKILHRKTNVLLSRMAAKQQQQHFALYHVFRSRHLLHFSFYSVLNAEVHQLLCFGCSSECSCLSWGSLAHRVLATGRSTGGKRYKLDFIFCQFI